MEITVVVIESGFKRNVSDLHFIIIVGIKFKFEFRTKII